MVMEIDSETGMPVLPEGLYWEVIPRKIKHQEFDEVAGWGWHYGDSESEFGVHIRKDIVRRKEWYEEETAVKLETYRKWFGLGRERTRPIRVKETVMKTEDVEESVTVHDYFLWDVRTVYKIEEKKRLEKEGWAETESLTSNHGTAIASTRWKMKIVHALTDETVKDAAIKCYTRWQEQEELARIEAEKAESHRVNRDRLVGKYPPKKLEV